MRFETGRTTLAAALKTVLPAIPKSTSTTALYGVRIDATDDGIHCTASSLDETITHRIDPTSLDTRIGTVIVNTARLARIVAGLDGANVTVEEVDDHVTIECGSSTVTLPRISVDDYPGVVTPTKSTKWVDLTSDDVTAIRRVLHAASTDMTKGLMRGVAFGGGLARATDSYRLAQATITDKIPEIVVDAGLLRRITSTVDDVNPLRIAVGDPHIHFSAGDTTWTTLPCATAPVMTSFPRFNTLIRDSSPHEVSIPLDALTAAVRRTETIGESTTDATPTVLTFGDGHVTIDRVNTDVGTIVDQIPIDGDASDVPPFGVRPEYFADLLDAASGDTITLGVDTSLRPVMAVNDGWIGLIMPIRTERIPQ